MFDNDFIDRLICVTMILVGFGCMFQAYTIPGDQIFCVGSAVLNIFVGIRWLGKI